MPKLESLTITGDQTVVQGESIQLTAAAEPANAKMSLTWASSDEGVLTVDGRGRVTAVAAGTATVTATDTTGVVATYEITVTPAAPKLTLTAEKENLTLKGETAQITPTVTGFENYCITWSADPALVSVNGGLVTVTGGSTTSQEVTVTATATSLDEDTYDQTVTSTITLTVQFNSYPLYYYALIPGKDANISGNADSRWFGLGVAQIEGVADPTSVTLGTQPTGYKINASSPSLALYPVVEYEGTKYTFAPLGSENADKEGYYVLTPLRVTVSNGTNAGANGYNPAVGGNTYHFDHTITLNEKDVFTVNFMVKDPGYDTFAAVQSGAQRVQSGTEESKLSKPTMEETKEYDGLTYQFDGWYTDEACTQKATFNGTITANTRYYGKYVPTEQYYTVEYYYDGQISQSRTVRGGPVNVGTEISTYPDKIITGFRFFRATVPLTVSADATQNVIRVYYVSRTYTVTYTDGVDGEEVFPDQVTENVTHGDPTPDFDGTPERKGYTFTGWNPEVADTVTANATYVAQWEQSDFALTINYVYEDGTPAETTYTKTVTYGDPYSVDSPKITGYTADLAVVKGTMPAENVTVTVRYTENTPVIINYVAEAGGSVNLASESVAPDTGTAVGSNATADADHYFVNWTNSNGEVVSTNATYVPGKNADGIYEAATYTANFAPKDVVTVTITGHTGGGEYKGSEYRVEGFDVNGTLPEGVTITLKEGFTAQASRTDVGTTKMNMTADSFSINNVPVSYRVVITNVTDGSVTVNPKSVKVTANDKSKTYGDLDPELTATVDGTLNSDKIVYTVKRAEGEDVDHYAITASGEEEQGNYKVSYVPGTLTITKNTTDLTVTGVDYSGTYDAAAHGEAATASVTEGTTISYSVDGGEWTTEFPTITNVGTVNVAVKAENSNYETATYTYTLEVTKRRVTFTGESGTRAYTGRPISLIDVEESGTGLVKGHTSNVEYLAEGTDVGTYTGTITAVEDVKIMSGNVDVTGNYAITTRAGALTITATPASDNITVVGTNTNKVYDGDPLAAATARARAEDGSEVTIEYSFDGENWTTDPSTLTATDVTEGTMVQIRASAANYSEYATGSETITITKRPVTVTTNSDSKVYDGVALTAPGEIKGIVKGETVTVNTTGSQTTVGSSENTYALTWGTAKESNYSVTDTIGTLTVTKQSINPEDPTEPDPEDPSKPVYTGAVVNDPENHVYDGAEHKFVPVVTDGEKTLTEGADYEVSYSTENFTDVTGTITVTITGNGNYAGTVTKSYEITPKAVTVTTETASKVYDGEALTAGGEIEGIVEGETVTVNTTGSQTEVGSSDNPYELVWGTAEESNYTLANETIGRLTVVPQSIDPEDPETPTDPDEPIDPDQSYYGGVKVGTLNDVTYNGESQVQRPTVTDKDGNALTEGKDYTLTWSEDTTNAGTVTVTVAGIGNYEGTVTRTYQINPRDVTLTSQTAAKAYDGTPLTRPNVTVTGNGFVAGEVTGVRANGTITNAGSVVNTIAYTVGNGFRPGNYQVTLNPGTLTINPAAQGTVTVTGSTGTFTWTGDARTITGYTHNGAARLITVNIDNADNASVSGTDVGHYNMGLTAANFTATSPNYRNVTVEVVDGYLDIEPINAAVTVTVRGNRETVAFDGQPHTVQGYEVVSAISNNGANVGLNSINLTFTGDDSVTGTEAGTYSMGLIAADFTITSDIYASVRVVVRDGELVITPAEEPEQPEQTTGPEDIEDETVPLASGPEDIPDEEVPLAAAPAWALVNLILSILTVLGSLLLLIGFIGKKKEEVLDEDGNAILDAEGNSLMNQIHKHGGWRLGSLLPAILSVIVFILTEDMRNPMILVDRWTLLMVIIAVVQILVAFFSKKETEKPEEETAVSV